MKEILTLDEQTVLCARQGQLSTRVGSETAILHCAKGLYFGVNATGTRVWALLQRPIRVGELLDHLLNEFDVDAERCRHDLIGFLQHLLRSDLVEVRVASLDPPEPSVER
jgi:hypothetical protein